MKKLYTLLLFVFIGLSIQAQVVYIPDSNFKAALLADTNINTNRDTSIQVSEASAFTDTIDVNNKGIADLTGIEAFTALRGLDCGDNNLTSLDVTANTVLTFLVCSENQLTNLNVSYNPAITYLDCNSNILTNVNISANTELTYFDCGFNRQLASLNVSSNTALTYLDCQYDSLLSLDVSANAALTYLECMHNNLTSLDVSANTALTLFDCELNNLTSLNVSFNVAIDSLFCNQNNLSNIDVSANTALIMFVCYQNHLTNLNLSYNTALSWLDCDNNDFTSLDLSHNPALVYLSCNNIKLTSLDVSNHFVLQSMGLLGDGLKSLNVSSDTMLVSFSCDYNGLTSLDVSSLTSLASFHCNNNNLQYLNIKNGHNQDIGTYWSDMTNNFELTCVEVDNPSYSSINWTGIVDPWVTFNTYCPPVCSANFTLSADTTQLHHYIATNNAYGEGHLSYDWSWGDGSPDDTIPYPSHTYADSGFYTICLSIIDSTGCISTYCDSSFHIMRTTNYMVYIDVVPPIVTGVKNIHTQIADLSIYPNPVTSELIIESQYQKIESVKLYNVLGEMLSSQNPIGNMVTIDMSNKPAGVYLIQITDADNNVINRKIIKQ